MKEAILGWSTRKLARNGVVTSNRAQFADGRQCCIRLRHTPTTKGISSSLHTPDISATSSRRIQDSAQSGGAWMKIRTHLFELAVTLALVVVEPAAWAQNNQ